MINSIKNIILISSLVFLSGCFGECMFGGFEYTSYGSDFYIYQTSDDLSNYTKEKVLNYTSTDSRPYVENQISNTRISVDGTVHFYFDGIPQIINYGVFDQDLDSLDVFRKFPQKYLSEKDIDIYPSRKTTVFADLLSDT
ncbi:MAG: hypothetical protein WD512_19705, partial [Candidatus Paceibacterota bacterium]